MNRLADVINSRISDISGGSTPLSLASVDSALNAVTDDGMELPQGALAVCRPFVGDALPQSGDRILICWLGGEPVLLGRLDPDD